MTFKVSGGDGLELLMAAKKKNTDDLLRFPINLIWYILVGSDLHSPSNNMVRFGYAIWTCYAGLELSTIRECFLQYIYI